MPGGAAGALRHVLDEESGEPGNSWVDREDIPRAVSLGAAVQEERTSSADGVPWVCAWGPTRARPLRTCFYAVLRGLRCLQRRGAVRASPMRPWRWPQGGFLKSAPHRSFVSALRA